MNKVISINIGGSIFQVEETAYDKLNSYLNELKKYFSNKPEGNEIITDIENRIAELMRARITPMKAAINLEDVGEVTSSIGSPKDFAIDEEEQAEEKAEEKSEEKRAPFTVNGNQPNRVYRDPDGRIIGGVCSGLGHYFKVDPIWIRLFFVIVTLTSLKLIFFGASPVLVYIILWIIIPEAKTTAEKLRMRKEKINIDNIQKSVQTEFNKVKDTMQGKDIQGRATSFARNLADFLKQLVMGVINFVRVFFKVFLYILAVVFFIAAIGELAGNYSFNYHEFQGVSLFNFFENNSDKITAQLAVLVVFLTVGFLCILLAKALSRYKLNPKTSLALRTGTIVLSVIATILVVVSSIRVATYFASNEKIESTMALDSTVKHYYLKTTNEDNYNNSTFFIRKDTLRINDIEVEVESTSGPSEVLIISSAFGQSSEMARLNAASIVAMFSAHDSMILIPNSFAISNNQVYRKQELKYKIKLHEGTRLTIDDNAWRGIMIKQNHDYKWGGTGNTYNVTATGLECEDCAKSYSGNINTSSYPMEISMKGHDFNAVKVSSGINVKIVKGNSYLIKARGSQNPNDIDVDFDNNTLRIRDNRKWNFNFLKNNTIDLIIICPELTRLDISGSVQAAVDGFDDGEMHIDMSGASVCVANIMVDKLNIEQSGATKLTFEGRANTCEAEVNGASKFYATNASVKFMKLEASGASHAEVNVEEKLDADASGASHIRYKGDVKEIKSNNSGASSVEKME